MVIGLALLLLGAGGWTARQMPIDVFPDLTAPTVTILTEGHGMAPEEMESLVTFPLESAINGASGVRRVRSATAVGIAVVWVEFDWGADIFMARQLVSEKLALVSGTLPPQVERPVLAPVSSIMGEILFFAISSEHDDPLTLRTIADTTVRRRLLAVPGVSQVTPIGGAERQFQVIAHPDALRANNVTLTELLTAVRGASQNTSAGVYTEGAQEYVLEAVAAPERLRRSERRSSRCVAIVPSWCETSRTCEKAGHSSAARALGAASRRSLSACRSSPEPTPLRSLAGSIASWTRCKASCRRHDDRPADLPSGRLHPGGRRKRLSGASRRWSPRDRRSSCCSSPTARASAITLTAIPLSLAAAILALRAFGANINTMTLGGMAIAVGDSGRRRDRRCRERGSTSARESRQARSRATVRRPRSFVRRRSRFARRSCSPPSSSWWSSCRCLD